MKEQPIIFSPGMVRAILEGRKTQTRRVVKPQPPHSCAYVMNGAGDSALCFGPSNVCVPPTARSTDHRLPCPYGVPGDRLWCREAWGLYDTVPSDGPERAHVYYKSTDGGRHDLRYQLWRSPVHMPRWASRILLELATVRVQRVQEISEEDAVAEGLPWMDGDGKGWLWHGRGYSDTVSHDVHGGVTYHAPRADGLCYCNLRRRLNPARCAYSNLWDSINAKRGYGFNTNPWVWALTFKVLEVKGRAA